MGKNNTMMMMTFMLIGIIVAVGLIIASQRNVIIDQLADNFYGIEITSGSNSITGIEWIAHGLDSAPSEVLITLRNSTYQGGSITASVTARNSTHFQVSVYNTNINRVSGITPVSSIFTTVPTDLDHVTDGNYTSATGEGQKSLSSAGSYGKITFDMGSSYPVMIIGNLNIRRVSGDGTCAVIIESSTDNVNFYSSGSASIVGKTTDTVTFPFNAGFLYARYFQLRFYSTGTSVPSVYGATLMEVKAIQYSSVPMTVSVDVDWIAKK